jgi:short-subunit dehydrogenase
LRCSAAAVQRLDTRPYGDSALTGMSAAKAGPAINARSAVGTSQHPEQKTFEASKGLINCFDRL